MYENSVYNLHFDDIVIARDWFKVGEEASEIVFRFMAYWMSFDFLYETYYKIQNSKSIAHEEGGFRHRKAISKFIDHYNVEFERNINFEADYMEIFKDRPVVPEPNNLPANKNYRQMTNEEFLKISKGKIPSNIICKILNDYKNVCNPDKTRRERIPSLFMIIYQVRCNLFHGAKNPHPQRNGELVKSSAEILGNCLPALFER